MTRMTSPYWEWLKYSEPIPDQLRWCHRTDAYALRDIVSDGQIIPGRCEVFRENISYFFYGRPAYRTREFDQIRLSSKAPIVIIFTREIELNGKRIFPFDSGAFSEMYKEWLHDKMLLEDFELPCGKNAPERQVSVFFGDRHKYLSMQPSKPETILAGDFEAEAIAEVLCDNSTKSADDRRLAIELQIDTPLPFDPSVVAAVIIPKPLLQAGWLLPWLRTHEDKIQIRTYELSPLRMEAHYQSILDDLAADLV